jgi:hypothetical protein
VRRVPAARGAEFLDLQPVLVLLLVFRRRIIAVLAFTALERNDFAHDFLVFSFQLPVFSFRSAFVPTENRRLTTENFPTSAPR